MVDEDDNTEANEKTSLIGVNTRAIDIEEEALDKILDISVSYFDKFLSGKLSHPGNIRHSRRAICLCQFLEEMNKSSQTSSALTSVQDVFTQTQLIKSEIEINNKAFVNKSNSLWDKLNAVSNEIKSVNLKSSHVNVLTETVTETPNRKREGRIFAKIKQINKTTPGTYSNAVKSGLPSSSNKPVSLNRTNLGTHHDTQNPTTMERQGSQINTKYTDREVNSTYPHFLRSSEKKNLFLVGKGKLDCVDVIFVHVGTNNVSDGDSVHAIIDDYRNLICTVRQSLPRTELVISSILPRPTHYQANRTIYDVNNRLLSLEEQHVEILDNTLDFSIWRPAQSYFYLQTMYIQNVAGAKVLSHNIISCVNTLLNLSDCTSETQSNFQSVRSTGRRFIPFNTTTQQQNVFRQTYWRTTNHIKRMSMSDTSRLIKESRRIVDASNDVNLNSGALLNMILEIVTGIDSTMRRMETSMEKRLDDLKQDFLTVSARVRTLENQASDFNKKLSDCETSCQGVSNLFDQVNGQVKTNRRNINNHDMRIKKLEEKSIVQPIVPPVIESKEIESLKAAILDLQCRLHVTFSKSDSIVTENNSDKNFVRWKSEQKSEYVNRIHNDPEGILATVMNKLDESSVNNDATQNDINNIVLDISKNFKNAAAETFGKIKKHKHFYKHENSKPWFNSKCSMSRKKFHKARKRYSFLKNAENRRKMRQASKEHKITLNKSFANYQQKAADELRSISKKDTKALWKILNNLNSSKKKITMTIYL
ncbi:unnamed protein product [Mytilus coruscus]|uniref:Uncharacterized protein n=1 Tax=Mytilus coruscus TaxID=42192 RepID=A0A6J8CW12_MYTCO|nr:unnamed protein product [Mytilus coruscus]